jgi:hypothetical protein
MASIYVLPNEIICHILSFLSDYDKLSFTSCSKHLRTLVNTLKFRSPIDFELIKDLPYFDRFTVVKYSMPSSNFKIPSCIQKIYASSIELIPRSGIKAQKIIIGYLGKSKDLKLINLRKFSTPHAEDLKYRIIVDLRYIQCREMKVADPIKYPIIIFAEGLEKLKIDIFRSYLILPDSLRILHCYSDVIIKRISQNLEELICKESVDIIAPFELPKNLSVFEAGHLGDGIRSALLSCYKSLKLKSLTIPFNIGLDFKYLDNIEELCIKDYKRILEKISYFPPKLKKLHIICSEYPMLLPKLPKTLKEFKFVLDAYEFSLPKLPSELEVLELGGIFIKEIDFPKSIRELTFSEYPHEIDFSRLCNLKILRIGDYYYDLTNLCDGLEELIFDPFSEYDREIILPHTVRKVRLSNSFNREILLPESLEEIIFGDRFNQKVVLPSRIVKVAFGNRFNQEIDLPDSLQEVSFGRSFDMPIKKLPSNLKRLRIGKRYKGLLPPLPKTLKELEFL